MSPAIALADFNPATTSDWAHALRQAERAFAKADDPRAEPLKPLAPSVGRRTTHWPAAPARPCAACFTEALLDPDGVEHHPEHTKLGKPTGDASLACRIAALAAHNDSRPAGRNPADGQVVQLLRCRRRNETPSLRNNPRKDRTRTVSVVIAPNVPANHLHFATTRASHRFLYTAFVVRPAWEQALRGSAALALSAGKMCYIPHQSCHPERRSCPTALPRGHGTSRSHHCIAVLASPDYRP